ncbi:MAG TPA: NUDIX domain-containing protein [Candidatus Paceibacterota bacterium]|nr:NUDIX domain-containing protein [Candidatus Paceibacterota bacterium]
MRIKEVSVGYLVGSINGTPSTVLLAVRQHGLGQGLYMPYGGEREPGEDPRECLKRELEEEGGVTCLLRDIEPVGNMDAIYKHGGCTKARINIHLNLVHDWMGIPQNTARNEMRDPVFFPVHRLPVRNMLGGDFKTLQRILFLDWIVSARAEYDLGTLTLNSLSISRIFTRLSPKR